MDNFSYDLEQMMEALEAPSVPLPAHIKTAEQFREWIKTFDTEDDNVNTR